jgi:hypothetical protein
MQCVVLSLKWRKNGFSRVQVICQGPGMVRAVHTQREWSLHGERLCSYLSICVFVCVCVLTCCVISHSLDDPGFVYVAPSSSSSRMRLLGREFARSILKLLTLSIVLVALAAASRFRRLAERS